MSSVPDGRTANQPFLAATFKPPMGALLPGALVSLVVIGSPASSSSLMASGDKLPMAPFSAGVAGTSTLL